MFPLLFFLTAFFSEVVGTIAGFGSSVFFVPLAGFFLPFHQVLALTSILHVFSNAAKLVLCGRHVSARSRWADSFNNSVGDCRNPLLATGRCRSYAGSMEEAEVPLENLHEEIHHSAEHSGETWISWVALSTAILAVLAAIAGLLSGMHANEAMMSQIEASDKWAYYQAKGIKAAVLDAKTSLSGAPSEEDRAKAERYTEEQSDIQKEANEKQAEAKSNFHQHEIFARSVTMFQIAIAIAAISALTKKRRFWIVSLFFGIAGCVFLALGFAH